MKVIVIIPAAGLGTRMAPMPSAMDAKTKKPHPSKQFNELAGTPILIHTLRKFAAVDAVSEIWIALRENEIEGFRERLNKEAKDVLKKKVELVVGGEHRQQSVEHALNAISAAPDDVVLVHDAVRPLVTAEIIQRRDRSGEEIWRRYRRPARHRYREASRTHFGRRDRQSYHPARRSRAGANAAGLPLQRHQESLRRSLRRRIYRHRRGLSR